MLDTGKSQQYTMVIADDHAIVRQGLRAALETPRDSLPEGIRVVGEAGNGFEADAEVKIHQPDLLLLDVSMQKS